MLLFLKTVTKPTKKVNYKGQNKIMKDKFEKFYEDHYKKNVSDSDKSSIDKIREILNYCKTDLTVAFNNHIKEHYYKFLCRYINLKCQKQKIESDIKNSNLSSKQKNK